MKEKASYSQLQLLDSDNLQAIELQNQKTNCSYNHVISNQVVQTENNDPDISMHKIQKANLKI